MRKEAKAESKVMCTKQEHKTEWQKFLTGGINFWFVLGCSERGPSLYL